MEKTTLLGCLLINKPKNITSFQCIKYLKKIINQKIKIGHSGTLDPFATGLLLVCIGREATKSISKLLNLDKEYIVKVKLGELTDTLDYTGTIIEIKKVDQTEQELETAIQKLGKEYLQTPPIYSAIKQKGRPLYKLVRNKEVDQKKLVEIIKNKRKKVRLYNIELLNYKKPFFSFKAHVSKGTYIRSLANDIAKNIKTFATTYKLKRTKIGKIALAKAISLDKIKTIEDIKNNLYCMDKIAKMLY